MINSVALDFVLIFKNYCPSCTEAELQRAIDLTQQTRMYMNQVITYKELENG
ncbi:putative protein disulfide-isomerase [Arthronema virus TR020]|uniref:Uncharacterized protein n=1 Tax=Arthronema virus TR020 TaxID=2736280 RepID=A0A7G3WH51_9CAUD|nr:putative protein disulfide-isomerase [Arthronema virus TR020]